MKEITLTEEQLKEKIDVAIAEELEKLDTEGRISELNSKLESSQEALSNLEIERDGLKEKVAEFETKASELFSEEQVNEKIAEAKESVKKEIETFNSRLTALIEAKVVITDEIKNDIENISDEQFGFVMKVLASKVETKETPVPDNEEPTSEVVIASVTSKPVPVGTVSSEEEDHIGEIGSLLKKALSGDYK